MSRRYLFRLLLAVMFAVYLAMLLWSLPHLRATAGGLAPFDLRPAGYSLAEAQALLAALGAEGRNYYLTVQQSLDSAYPALLAVVLVLAFRALAPGWPGLGLSVLAVLGSGFDYLENARVAVLLRAGPEAVTAEMVAAANRATVLKSAAVTLAMVALLVLLANRGWRRWRRRAA
jgi:hypothetical protein